MRYLALASILAILLTMFVSTTGASYTEVVFRGHVGAVKGNFYIIWVEDVVSGPLSESGVIEVYREDLGCQGNPSIDKVKVGDYVEVKGYLVEDCCRKHVILDCDHHYLKLVQGALMVKIKVVRGCGSSYYLGERVTILIYLNKDANVSISEKTPNGTFTIFSGLLRSGMYYITGESKEPIGNRTVCIIAESGDQRASSCCDFNVVPRGKDIPKTTGRLIIQVLTDAGYPIRNASVYIDGSFYGYTDQRGILETNITEGKHEVLVESEYYRTMRIFAGPEMVVIRAPLKPPEVVLRFEPDNLAGSNMSSVKLIVERVSGPRISVKVDLITFGDIWVNTTSIVGTPTFNATILVSGTGKVIARYGNLTTVLVKTPLATQTKTSETKRSITRTKWTETSISTSMISTSEEVSSPQETRKVPELSWYILLIALPLVVILSYLILRGRRKEKQLEARNEGISSQDRQ